MEKQKYYYLYKITNNITGEYYYGVHETWDLNDYYFGSGSLLKSNIKKYGLENFTKVILEFFPSRKEVMKEEKRIVNQELLKDPKCLNVILGDGELKGSVGKKCIVDDNGVYRMVDKDDDTYPSFQMGRICINKDGKLKYIKPYELDQYIQNGWKQGTIYVSPGKGKIWVFKDDLKRQIYKEELQQYLDNGWKKGSCIKGTHMWVNKNGNTKQIYKEELQQYLDNGWKKGFGKPTVNGKIVVSKENKRKYILKEELQQYLDNGWKKGSWKNVWVNKDRKNVRIIEDKLQEYLDNGWIRGRYSEYPPRARKVLFYDLNGNLVKEFIRVSDANKEGFNNIHKYADKNRIYMGKYILKYGL